MSYPDSAAALAGYRSQIAELRRKMREIQASAAPEAVDDYGFAAPDGTVHLSDLFGAKRDLIVIHNMGTSCASCTLGRTGSTGCSRTLPIAPLSWSRAPIRRTCSSNSPRVAAGSFRW